MDSAVEEIEFLARSGHRVGVIEGLTEGPRDPAIRLGSAETARARYGWPLHVNDDDDPKLKRPEAFLKALRGALDGDPSSRGRR